MLDDLVDVLLALLLLPVLALDEPVLDEEVEPEEDEDDDDPDLDPLEDESDAMHSCPHSSRREGGHFFCPGGHSGPDKRLSNHEKLHSCRPSWLSEVRCA